MSNRRFADAPDVLTIQDAQRLLPYSVNTLRALCARGEIPAIKPEGCRRWLIPKAALVEWLERGGFGHGQEDS